MVLAKVSCSKGETVSGVCARLGYDFSRGCGFYLLTKKETISADKELILWNGSRFIQKPDEIRSTLKLKSGAVSVAPSSIPAGMELFVQSTSATRKLDGGSVVLRVAKLKASPEVDEADGDDDDDGDNEEEDHEGEEDEEGDIGMIRNSVFDWERIRKLGFGEYEYSDPESFRDEDEDDEYCEPYVESVVPVEDVQPVVQEVLAVGALIRDWRASRVEVRPPGDLHTAESHWHHWMSPSTGCQLLYVYEASDNDFRIVLDHPEKAFGVVLGVSNSYPYVLTKHWMYENPNMGTSVSLPTANYISPECILSLLAHYTVFFANNC